MRLKLPRGDPLLSGRFGLTLPFGPEKNMMSRVMMTFWMVRKKFSPYVENGKLDREA